MPISAMHLSTLAQALVYLSCSTLTSALPGLLVSRQSSDVSQSQPNPIASTYPNNVTGTINGTISVIPIDYSLARAIIPAQYPILSSYRDFLPFLGKGKYPLVVETVIDHNVEVLAEDFHVPDFSSVRITFPFVDLLNDNYSTFRYVPTIYLSNNSLAISGSEAYGETVINAIFDPVDDPYAFVPAAEAVAPGETYFDVYSAADVDETSPIVRITNVPHNFGARTIPLAFYKNMTNQPTFGRPAILAGSNSTVPVLTCDNFIRFFSTSISAPPYAPKTVVSKLTIAPNAGLPAGIAGKYHRVQGLQVDNAFLENNWVSCAGLKGYTYGGW